MNNEADKYCEICGAKIPRTPYGFVRLNAKYCGDVCRKKAQYKYNAKYIRERRKVDEEFRERRRAQNRVNNRNMNISIRNKRYDKFADIVIDMVLDCTPKEDIKKFLMENTRLKTDGVV